MQNPSQDFLALMETNITTKREALNRLISLVNSMKAELAEEERLYATVEKYAKAERLSTEAFVSAVANADVNKLGAKSDNNAVQPPSFESGNETQHARSMAAQILRGAGRVMSSPQILAAILETGYVFKSTNPPELIKSALKRSPEFRTVGRGYWLSGVDVPVKPSATSKPKRSPHQSGENAQA